LSHGKPYSSLPGVDRVEVGNVAIIGYLVAFRSVLFCSLAVLDPRVGHTVDVLTPFIPVLLF